MAVVQTSIILSFSSVFSFLIQYIINFGQSSVFHHNSWHAGDPQKWTPPVCSKLPAKPLSAPDIIFKLITIFYNISSQIYVCRTFSSSREGSRTHDIMSRPWDTNVVASVWHINVRRFVFDSQKIKRNIFEDKMSPPDSLQVICFCWCPHFQMLRRQLWSQWATIGKTHIIRAGLPKY